MRVILILVPALLAASPALAAPPGIPTLPQVLTDPSMADQLGRVAGVLTKSLMDLPVGEVEAAIEGRRATRADRARTIGDSIGDPRIAERIAQETASSSRTMQTATKALVAAVPAIVRAVEGARGEIERAIGNFPDPTYPRR